MTDHEGEYVADCRARIGFDLLTNRWNSVVVYALADGPMRPGTPAAQIGGISAKVLNETLRRLEYHGLVIRRGSAARRVRADRPGRDPPGPVPRTRRLVGRTRPPRPGCPGRGGRRGGYRLNATPGAGAAIAARGPAPGHRPNRAAGTVVTSAVAAMAHAVSSPAWWKSVPTDR